MNKLIKYKTCSGPQFRSFRQINDSPFMTGLVSCVAISVQALPISETRRVTPSYR